MNSPTRLGQCILSLSLFTRRGENWRFSRSFVDAPVGAGALSAGNLSLSIALLDETDRAAHVDDVGNVLRPQQQHNCWVSSLASARGPIRNSSACRFE